MPLAPRCYNISMNLQADIVTVKGVGPKTAAALRQAGIQTVGDLLYLLPRTYENYQTVTDIAHLRPGKVMVKGKITNLKTSRAFKRRLTITEGIIRDATGALRTLWFNQAYRERQFDPQREYYFSGTYEFRRGRYQLTSPTAVLAADVDEQPAGLQPLYPADHGTGQMQFPAEQSVNFLAGLGGRDRQCQAAGRLLFHRPALLLRVFSSIARPVRLFKRRVL